jgi:hypothetical protein
MNRAPPDGSPRPGRATRVLDDPARDRESQPDSVACCRHRADRMSDDALTVGMITWKSRRKLTTYLFRYGQTSRDR